MNKPLDQMLARISANLSKLMPDTKQVARHQMGIALANKADRQRVVHYGGTVSPAEKARRRARNKAAHKARMMHRKAAR